MIMPTRQLHTLCWALLSSEETRSAGVHYPGYDEDVRAAVPLGGSPSYPRDVDPERTALELSKRLHASRRDAGAQ